MSDQTSLRILVVTRSYPSASDLYQYPFVHRRVLAYRALGHEVSVFRPTLTGPSGRYEFDGVRCYFGAQGDLALLADGFQPDVIAAHGMDEQMWSFLEPIGRTVPIRAWLHGSEIPEFYRQKAGAIADLDAREDALERVDRRCRFWAKLLARMPDHLGLVFVSRCAVEMARIDWGEQLRKWTVIPNPIDTDLFAYRRKTAADRLAVLMIRPFDSFMYGNDMAIEAIGILSRRSDFERFRFSIFGDGPLHDVTVAPVRALANVRVDQRFLTQAEIAVQHAHHGIFLVPTRLDTHGVSRDEAMASGLVPVTNRICAVPEYVDDDCGVLAPGEDAGALAEGIATMAANPALFLKRSAAAAARVRAQSGKDIVVPMEIAHLRAAARD